MTIKKGATAISAVRKGAGAAFAKVYKGAALVFTAGGGAPPAGATLGVIANGDFAGGTANWVTSGGWSISGGQAVGTSADNSLRQNAVLALGVTYLCTFDYTMTSGSALRAGSLGGGMTDTPVLGASGSVSLNFTVPATDTGSTKDFAIQAVGATFTGTVDNVSVTAV